MSFASQLATSQQRRHELAADGWTEDQARLNARDEAFADLDPHGDEIGFPGHVATFLIGATAVAVGFGFFVPLVSASDQQGTSALDKPVILIPLIAAIVGCFMLFASAVWLYNDYQNGRCNCRSTFKVVPGSAKDIEAQNEILSPTEALIVAKKESRKKERQEREERMKELPKTILFANDRILILQELFQYYCRDLDTDEIGCNGLAELMMDTMTGGVASLQESREFMGKIDLDGDKMVQRSEYLEFMCNRWSTESPLASKFASMDDFLVKLHEMRIIKNSGINNVPVRVPVLARGGIPARVVEEQELGALDANEKVVLNREIIKDLFKWYDKDSGKFCCAGHWILVWHVRRN